MARVPQGNKHRKGGWKELKTRASVLFCLYSAARVLVDAVEMWKSAFQGGAGHGLSRSLRRVVPSGFPRQPKIRQRAH